MNAMSKVADTQGYLNPRLPAYPYNLGSHALGIMAWDPGRVSLDYAARRLLALPERFRQ